MATIAQKLEKAGYYNFHEYLKSPHWQRVNDAYRASDFPQHCVGCGNESFELVHQYKNRICMEQMWDMLPLCNSCHHKIKSRIKFLGIKTPNYQRILSSIYNWSRVEARRRFKQFNVGGNINDWVLADPEQRPKEST